MIIDESPNERRFREKVRRFALNKIVPFADKVEEGTFPKEVLAELGHERLLGAPFPVADGGLGLGWAWETIVAEEISAVSGATEMARLASGALYSAPLAYFGNKEEKKEVSQTCSRRPKSRRARAHRAERRVRRRIHRDPCNS